jgi:hypothetical protein
MEETLVEWILANQKRIPISGDLIKENATKILDRDALPSPKLNPLEGPIMLSCGKLKLEGRSQLPALKRGRGAC